MLSRQAADIHRRAQRTIVRVSVCAAILSPLLPSAHAQPLIPGPQPIALGGGLLGGGASWLPNVPLTPRAQGNLAAQSAARGAGGTWQSEISYEHGQEFVSYRLTGGPSWNGPDNPEGGITSTRGRGSVSASFRISRFEVPTASWVEFFNAVDYVRRTERSVPEVGDPTYIGAARSAGIGSRWTTIPGREMYAVSQPGWRVAAMYCNWLHNDRQWTYAALSDGAYDISTFGTAPTGGFTDQLRHHPGARFWIPTLDEWMAAAHYDPSAATPEGEQGPGRWWHWATSSDTQPIFGSPAMGGEANTDDRLPLRWDHFSVPLGAYTNVQSPWGLLDAAGHTMEYTEEAKFVFNRQSARALMGGGWIDAGDFGLWGALSSNAGGGIAGLRVAAAIPSPGSTVALAFSAIFFVVRRRRSTPECSHTTGSPLAPAPFLSYIVCTRRCGFV